jgi:hypothetical protein
MRLFMTFFLNLLLAASAFAGLVFEQTEIVHSAGLTEEKTEAVFRFTNTGSEAVTVIDPVSSCGCTVPKLEKKVYQPGESGEIKAVFTYGSRVGVQRKRITLKTIQPSAETHLLTMVTHIPEWVEIEPRVLRWKIGEPASARQIRVKAALPEKVELELPEAAFRYFRLEVEEVAPGSYVLTVTPNTLDVKATEFLRFNAKVTDQGISRNRTFGVHCLIR